MRSSSSGLAVLLVDSTHEAGVNNALQQELELQALRSPLNARNSKSEDSNALSYD
jgi:hypothetical protein